MIQDYLLIDNCTIIINQRYRKQHIKLEISLIIHYYTSYPEWPHRQCVGLAYPWTRVRAPVAAVSVSRFVARIYTGQYVELRGYYPWGWGVRPTSSYWYRKTLEPKPKGKVFQWILLNNNTLVIINSTNEKNCCYFPIEKRIVNIIYCNKTLKIVVFWHHILFFWHLWRDRFVMMS